jgi:hypothetical protein
VESSNPILFPDLIAEKYIELIWLTAGLKVVPLKSRAASIFYLTIGFSG